MAQERTLAGVPDTTYIPLVARIYVSKRFPDYFRDEQALALESQIPGEAIQANSGEYECMASVARSHVIDGKVSTFLAQHPSGNVVFLGGGLETTWGRVGAPTAHCYQVDLPEVVEVRRRALDLVHQDDLVGHALVHQGQGHVRPHVTGSDDGCLALLHVLLPSHGHSGPDVSVYRILHRRVAVTLRIYLLDMLVWPEASARPRPRCPRPGGG